MIMKRLSHFNCVHAVNPTTLQAIEEKIEKLTSLDQFHVRVITMYRKTQIRKSKRK